MQNREIIALSSDYTKTKNALCGQNAEFLNVKPGGSTQSKAVLFKKYYKHASFNMRHI